MRSRRVPGYVTLAAAGLILLLQGLGVIRSLEDKSVRPLEFKLRSFLQKSPQLDPRLKIYAFDDSTLRFMKKPDLDFELWIKVLQTIADAGPRLIMIDKIFTVVDAHAPLNDLQQELAKLPVDVVTAVYATPHETKFKAPLPTDFSGFELAQWMKSPASAESLPWLPQRDAFIFGPDPELWQGFRRFGHILYESPGSIDLFVRYGATQAVPHWSLQAADQIQLDDKGLTVQQQRVPQVQGRVAVNMIDSAVLEKNIYSLVSVIHRARQGKDLRGRIQPDQIVVILPGMFTGHTDRVETPNGSVPGSYLVLSLINSVLTGQWIRTVPGGLWEILAFAGLGWLVTLHFHAIITPLILFFTIMLTIAGGVLSFVYASWQMPWLGASLALGCSGLTNLIWIAMARVREAQKITRAVSGLVPQEHIKALIQGQQGLEFEPSGHVVSIMFVDIVGFSLTTKKLTASETFLQLKGLLGDITDIVHRHEGTIDKTLGDGLLCFFGYNVLGQPNHQHADQAVRCAIEIQRQVFRQSLKAYAEGKALYPLRIGINTASVFIGNIGNRQRFDFTMVGDGVNFAARLETACAPFKIMIGPATREQLKVMSPDHPGIQRRLVMVKHTSELQEAWEVDPFHGTGEEIDRIEKLYWNYAGLYQREERFPVNGLRAVRLQTSLGSFQLLNYSHSGLGIQSSVFLAQGVVFNVTFEADDSALQSELQQWGLASIIVEICWGSPSSGGFEHGVRFVGLSDEQKARIFRLLHQRETAPKIHAPAS